ncbi:MAG: FAD-binding protein [Alphaproteobacteria bacterium]|nr:FAD-binding protein [Alphaproteobacteria bacterium]
MSGVNRIPGGLLVDAARPVRFTFEGRAYDGLAGDTIASALAANDVRVLSRSFKYHRPRGIHSMAAWDANALVQLPGEPNVPAERTPIVPGLAVRGQNYRGSLAHDRDAWLGRFARFMPVGFYYRAFFKPHGAWQRFWEPRVRALAGLGAVALDAPHGHFDKVHNFCDVAVIGGGRAGLSAALAAAGAGDQVLLVDHNPVLGGALNYGRAAVERAATHAERDRLVGAVGGVRRITVMTGAVANGYFADHWLAIIQGSRLHRVRAGRVVLATGAIEQPAVFRGNDIPGVMLGSAAQRLIRLYGVRPGRTAVVVAGTDDGYGVALDLLDAGATVSAIVELRPEPSRDPRAVAAAGRNIRIVNDASIIAAEAVDGHLAAIAIRRQGDNTRHGEAIVCDLAAVSVGRLPAYQLALQAGGRLDYDDARAHFSIAGLPPGVTLAGWTAGEDIGANHPWPIYPHPDGKAFVDFDEDLQIDDIENAVAEGYREIELVKRFSTVGMGPSQGRHSALTAARLVAKETGRRVGDVGVTTARPPVVGEKLGVLAGRGFDPERKTAMHHRHLEAGAQMMTAGAWWRPAYYGVLAHRADAIAREVRAVRTAVGMIDVSTLGGLEIRGPDAAEFMNRMYTFTYTKQAVNRLRYVLMVNESGAIIDDGVACRFGDDHFYVTTTTTGSDRVYQTMLWWNAKWRLDVDIANATAAFAGVNIAGPRARDVLAPLVEGCGVDAGAFPYLGAFEARIAGIPARFLRVGFVGELGFEVHVPASQGEALWDALMDTGRGAGLVPFGVEAQRVLRLEKGHIIVGQDTDAMTTPEEADMLWAIAAKKPFFIGKRALVIRDKHLSRRKLVGFAVAGAPPLQESNLVLKGGNAVGFVTSVAWSPTLNRTIGLAYAAREDAAPDRSLVIRLDDGRDVRATVVKLPFYDPDAARQAL